MRPAQANRNVDFHKGPLFNLLTTVDDFERTLGSGGISIGVFEQEQLIAYACVLFPGLVEDNLGIDLGLPNEELSKVAHLEGPLSTLFTGGVPYKKKCGLHWKRSSLKKIHTGTCARPSPHTTTQASKVRSDKA
ncbi:MAG: hypothetical protein HQK52_23460 [Oligoflexia bacterium]|nr:hypothetical protein [Oligoflexia bacterium]